jgi:hypothetical protein
MQISMYQASVPVFVRAFRNLIQNLEKGAAHAAERKLDEKLFTAYRLAPDMYPLSRQVQIATDVAKGSVSRLAGVEIPSYTDEEQTFAELIARLEKTIAYLEGFKPAQLDGTETKVIKLERKGVVTEHSGLNYLQQQAVPNVYFHCTTTYAILRHAGVALGKKDFLGKPD